MRGYNLPLSINMTRTSLVSFSVFYFHQYFSSIFILNLNNNYLKMPVCSADSRYGLI